MFVCKCKYNAGNQIGSIHEVGCPALGIEAGLVDVEVDLDESFAGEITAGEIREFASGATRDTDEGKLDFEGFFSPGVMFRFAQYMNENRMQSDGNMRDSDNWQKGIPRDQYMKSMYRHFMEVWAKHRALQGAVPIAMADEMETALCAMMFNVMGYLFEMQQGR